MVQQNYLPVPLIQNRITRLKYQFALWIKIISRIVKFCKLLSTFEKFCNYFENKGHKLDCSRCSKSFRSNFIFSLIFISNFKLSIKITMSLFKFSKFSTFIHLMLKLQKKYNKLNGKHLKYFRVDFSKLRSERVCLVLNNELYINNE